MQDISLLLTSSSGELSIPTVILLGLGIVFFGLICLILLCKISGKIISLFPDEKKAAKPVAEPTAQTGPVVIENRGAFIAAVSAAIAEDLGTDVSAIRILSVKKA